MPVRPSPRRLRRLGQQRHQPGTPILSPHLHPGPCPPLRTRRRLPSCPVSPRRLRPARHHPRRRPRPSSAAPPKAGTPSPLVAGQRGTPAPVVGAATPAPKSPEQDFVTPAPVFRRREPRTTGRCERGARRYREKKRGSPLRRDDPKAPPIFEDFVLSQRRPFEAQRRPIFHRSQGPPPQCRSPRMDCRTPIRPTAPRLQ